ncbi:RNA-binding domain-containing protein [Hesseltinella vesiculosa]|uniref:RNA-binding domain-containing protein n=1 Tax=Hesseltinella vesiculosa TaxID=101127 RepID=A0A1X2GWC3_9FUNG|nr:RNA-binding domain-containing protein [Hesseltinella vesiculosa]
MSGKKKPQKMSLTDFLADDSGTSSWADEMADLPSAPAGPRDDGFSSGGRFDRDMDDMPRGPARNNRYDNNDRFQHREERRESHDRGFRGHGDRGGDRGDRGARSFPARAPVPLPTEPPFTAYVGNLSFEATEDDVAQFLGNQGIVNIRILRDRVERSKGYGYVEFEDVEALKAAVDLSGEDLQSRPVRINVAEPQKERTDRPDRPERMDRTNVTSWRRDGPVELPDRPERSERRFDGAPRRGGFRDRQERPERGFMERRSDTSWSGGAFTKNNNRRDERPRMNLKPRSVDHDADSAPQRGNKPSPFGEARPVDTAKVMERVEEKMTHLNVDDASPETQK